MADDKARPGTPEFPPEIHAMPGHLIRRLHQASVAIFDKRLRNAGIDLTPVQFAALVMLERNPGVDQATLAQGIAYDRVTIGGVLERLEAKGLVRREAHPEDRRVRRVFPEPAGLLLLQQALPVVREAQGPMLVGLTPEEARQFTALLAKALAAVGEVARLPAKPGS